MFLPFAFVTLVLPSDPVLSVYDAEDQHIRSIRDRDELLELLSTHRVFFASSVLRPKQTPTDPAIAELCELIAHTSMM